MIKATVGTKDGRRMLILGLEAKNMEMLLAGKPIVFDLEPFGFDGLCTIMGGKTLDVVVEQLEELGLAIPMVPDAS